MSGGFSFPPPPPPPPKANTGSAPDQINGDRTPHRGRGGTVRGGSRGGGGGFRGRGNPNWGANHGSPARRTGDISRGAYHATQPSVEQLQHPGHAKLPPGAYVNPSFAGSGARHPHPTGDFRGPREPPLSKDGSPSRTAAGQKRKLEVLRGPQHEKRPAPPTAPAVPSFGFLPLNTGSQSPLNASNGSAALVPQQKSTAKGLGLTPGTVELQYPASENEDDEVDEEVMYAELGNKLTFEHNGVVMSLNSHADLVAWKKERKSNWPTKSRMADKDEERRRVGEERKRLLAGGVALVRKVSRIGTNRKTIGDKVGIAKRPDRRHDSGGEAAGPESSDGRQERVTEFERMKAALLIQEERLANLRKKVAESEERNRKARAQDDEPVNPTVSSATAQNEEHALENDAHATVSHFSQAEEGEHSDKPQAVCGEIDDEAEAVSEGSESDSTSSMSSSSDSLSAEEDSDNEQPEEATSKSAAVLPSSTDAVPCRYFTASGYCRDGEYCRYKHERQPPRSSAVPMPSEERHQFERWKRQSEQQPSQGTRSSIGIFERMAEQEQEAEGRLALKAVKYLGNTGFFKQREEEE